LIVTNQKQRRRTNYHQEPPGEQKTHEPTPVRCNAQEGKHTSNQTTRRSKTADREQHPPKSGQRHTTTTTNRQKQKHNTHTKHTRSNHNTQPHTNHPTHHETRTTHQQPANTRRELNHNATATAKAIKNTQLPQKNTTQTPRRHGETPGTTASTTKM